MKPEQDKVYVCNGFRFYVRGVNETEVFVARFPVVNPGPEATLIRVSLAVWEKEMADAQEVKS